MNNLGYRFQLDPIIAGQMLDNSKGRHFREPEKELMLAVLADAIECFWQHCCSWDGTGAKLFQDAAQWIFSDDDENHFSFLNICDALKLNPSYLRRGIRDGKDKRVSGKILYGARPINFRVKSMTRNLKQGGKWTGRPSIGARPTRGPSARTRMRGAR